MTATAEALPAAAAPEGLDFRFLGGNLGRRFDLAYARCGSETEAAMEDAARAERAATERAHARLDHYQFGTPVPVDVMASWAPPDYAVAAVGKTLAERADAGAAGPDDKTLDAHMAAFIGLHDAQDAAEGVEPEPDEPAEAGAPAEDAPAGCAEDGCDRMQEPCQGCQQEETRRLMAGDEPEAGPEGGEDEGPCDGGCASVLGKGPCDCGPEAPDGRFYDNPDEPGDEEEAEPEVAEDVPEGAAPVAEDEPEPESAESEDGQ